MSRPKIRIQFPQIKEFLERRAARSSARKRRISRALPAGALPLTFRREPASNTGVSNGHNLAQNSARKSGGGLNAGAAARSIKNAVMRIEFGPGAAIGGLFVLAVTFGLLYLAHFNQVATKGYDLRRLEADRQQLLNQYDIKNMKLAEVKSLTNILTTNRVAAMRKPAEVIFVRAGTALAQVDSL